MQLIKPSFKIEYIPENLFTDLERFGRTCYKSEDNITNESGTKFIDMIVNDKHHYSVLRHKQASVRFICSRGTSHQLVRHGLAHFLQESQRYCNYSKKNNGELLIIIPFYLHDKIPIGVFHNESEISITPPSDGARVWLRKMFEAEEGYHTLIKQGWKPERARGVLPNDAKTELVLTANLEEWRHIFKQRADNHADESMQWLMYPLLEGFKKAIPIIFDDLGDK